MRAGRLICVALVALIVLAGTATARPPSSRRLDAHFQSMGMDAPETSGNDAFFANPPTPAGIGWLRNDATGETWTIPVPTGCIAGDTVAPLSGGWLLEPCSPSMFARYRLPDGPWQMIPETSECANGGPGNLRCGPVAVGAWWVALQTSSEGQPCCGYLYQNLVTGAVTGGVAPSAGEIDLNDRGLTPRFCPTLEAHASQILAIEGRFALLGRAKANDGSVLFLDRCGWKRAIRLGLSNDFAAGHGFFVWTTSLATHLTGVLLPSGRHFEESIPAAATNVTIQATNTRIYLGSLIAGVRTSWEGRAP